MTSTFRLQVVVYVSLLTCGVAFSQTAPVYYADPTWPQPLPNNWKLGGVIGLELIRSCPELLRSLITFGTTYHLDRSKHLVTVQTVTFAMIGRKRLPGLIAKTGTTVDSARPVIRAM